MPNNQSKTTIPRALMCSRCGLTFQAGGDCPQCFPRRATEDQSKGTMRVAPSVADAGSEHLFFCNRRNIERWLRTHLANVQALRSRIADRIGPLADVTNAQS